MAINGGESEPAKESTEPKIIVSSQNSSEIEYNAQVESTHAEFSQNETKAEVLLDSDGEEFRIIRGSTVADASPVWEPHASVVRRAQIWRNRQHRKMIASVRRLIEWQIGEEPTSIEHILETDSVRDLTDDPNDIREAVSKSLKIALNELDQIIVRFPEVCNEDIPPPVPPLLALPYKRFIFKFDGTDFQINSKPLRLCEPIANRASTEAIDGDTGNTVWDAAVFLCQYLDGNPAIVRGKHLLELGSGLGLCGIAASLVGATSVCFTDLDYVLNTTRSNVALNDLDPATHHVVELDWSKPEKASFDYDMIQTIIASDVIWLDKLIDPFLNTLIFLSAKCVNFERIILSNQRRSDIVRDSFLFKAQKNFHLDMSCVDGTLEIITLTKPS